MDRNHVTMPRWPAWIMGGLMAACAYLALTASAPAGPAAADTVKAEAAPR